MKDENINESKMDFSKEPLMIEIGTNLFKLFDSPEKKQEFYSCLKDVQKELDECKNIRMPEVQIVKNPSIMGESAQIFVYGRVVESFIIPVNIIALIGEFREFAMKYYYFFEEDFKKSVENLEEMRHEQSREACQFLYRYYSSVELDKKQAFHWLKKMSYYGVPKDIKKLSECYKEGRGCDEDMVQGYKLHDLINDYSDRKRRF